MTKRLKQLLENTKENTIAYATGRPFHFPYKPKRKYTSELELWSECEMLDNNLTSNK
jgi:hypothetical protein